MNDATVMLIAVLVPCLLTTLVVSTILYRGFYKDWMYRCLRSGPGVDGNSSEQQRQQPDQNDDTGDGNRSADVEALREHGHPRVISSPAKPLFSWAVR